MTEVPFQAQSEVSEGGKSSMILGHVGGQLNNNVKAAAPEQGLVPQQLPERIG